MNPARRSVASDANRERLMPALQHSMQEVFELMLASPLEISLESPPAGLDITAMVGLAGELCGILSVRCASDSAARMASRILGINPEEAGPEMWDAVGEIANMVAGNFKNKIAGLGDACMLSVPTVITGADYNVHSMVHETIQTVFIFEGEPVVLSLEIH